MIRKTLRVCLGTAIVIVAGAACVFAVTPSITSASPLSTAATSAKTAVVNKAIDATGVKGAVEDSLMAHAYDIANVTGISTTQVQNIIEGLDIDDWQAATVPASATPTATISGSAAGVPASLTTYADPNYVTISAYGQDIDLAVPASAQQYLPLLSYAKAA